MGRSRSSRITGKSEVEDLSFCQQANALIELPISVQRDIAVALLSQDQRKQRPACRLSFARLVRTRLETRKRPWLLANTDGSAFGPL
jgi:hypothetical protein